MTDAASSIPEHAKVTDLVSRLEDRIGELRRHL
ncbi:hypothetical protein ENSA7_28040 [Enhygromyxa salina]|uniref:Uncharacterized protein n=1 Tax=Enhygromyxa salina TaxID=215803 RepID=A0A2S9YQY8_9BACT|nr:hypothetical protein ENSA7_28040 [Enhygromyxa salina]